MLKSVFRIYLFLTALSISFTANAAGLGKLTVNSYLGQLFKAEIDLVSVKNDDIPSLRAGLASSDTFVLADVDYASILDSFEFSIQKRENGQPYIKIVSLQPVADVSIRMLIKLNWPGGNLIREYTVFLESPSEEFLSTNPEIQSTSDDMPDVAISEQRAAKELDSVIENLISKEDPVTAAPVSEEQIKSENTPHLASDADFEVTTYGPVKKGDTLIRIAQEVISYKVQLNQLLIALQQANPEAFTENNINLLKAGTMLRIPELAEVETISPDEADVQVKMHTVNWEAYRQKLAAEASFIIPDSEDPEQTVTGEITTIIEDEIIVTEKQESPEGILKLSSGITEGSEVDIEGDAISIQKKFNMVEDNIIASEKALNEANQRISLLEHTLEETRIANELALSESNQRIIALEKNIKELKGLLEIKNQTVANAEMQTDLVLSETQNLSQIVEKNDTLGLQNRKEDKDKDESIKTESNLTESIKTESNLMTMNQLLWIVIIILFIGLTWKTMRPGSNKSSESADTN